MQHLRQLLAATAIICALSSSTFAGDMHYPVEPPPSEPITSSSSTPTTSGEAGSAETSSNYLGEVVWSIIENLNFTL